MSSPWPSKTCCVYHQQGIATPPLLYSYSAAAPGPAHRVVCRSKFPWSIKSSPPALPFDTLVTGMVWPIVFPNQITEMHILHEAKIGTSMGVLWMQRERSMVIRGWWSWEQIQQIRSRSVMSHFAWSDRDTCLPRPIPNTDDNFQSPSAVNAYSYVD